MQIQADHLFVSYEDPKRNNKTAVLQDLSFQVQEGRSLAILGSNGSGKTTLLKTLCGILPYSGTLTLGGEEIKHLSRKKISSRIAMLGQLSSVYFSYTVYETVLLGRYIHTNHILGLPTPTDHKVVNEVLETTGLTDLAEKQISELSGGQLQRVYLARTLAQQTPILLLDEPTNHLDLKVQAELLSYLSEWKKGSTALADGSIHPHTLIGVFHDLAMALRIADDLLCLKNGKILAYGTKKDILNSSLLQNVFDFDVVSYLENQSKYLTDI